MIWWRGNGVWIGFFAFFPAVAMGKLGATQLALAYATSAVLLFLLRDWIGRDSALFSLPTKFWPPLVLLIALVVQFTSPKSSAANNTQNNTQKAVAELQASVPRMLGDQIRIDRMTYDGSTLHYFATAMVSMDVAGAGQAGIDQIVRKHYCENAKAIWQANISIVFKMVVPPRSLSDRVNSYSQTFYPSECKPATH
jgi:hypothetical protein